VSLRIALYEWRRAFVKKAGVVGFLLLALAMIGLMLARKFHQELTNSSVQEAEARTIAVAQEITARKQRAAAIEVKRQRFSPNTSSCGTKTITHESGPKRSLAMHWRNVILLRFTAIAKSSKLYAGSVI
jgi:regulatory protein YycI of two-component signal transduction system YycFG